MSETLEPISPSEAAQILSNSRWNRDEANEQAPSEDFLTGIRATEAAQGYSEMPRPLPKEEPKAIEAKVLADTLKADQEEIAAPVEINYLEGGDPAKPMPPNQTVSVEDASADLAAWRDNIGEQIKAAEDQAIANAIDQLRAGDQQQQQAAGRSGRPGQTNCCPAGERRPRTAASDR